MDLVGVTGGVVEFPLPAHLFHSSLFIYARLRSICLVHPGNVPVDVYLNIVGPDHAPQVPLAVHGFELYHVSS